MRQLTSMDIEKRQKFHKRLSPLSVRARCQFSAIEYEYISAFNSEFTIALPCHVLAVAKYKCDEGFTYRTGNYDFYELFIVYSGSLSYCCRNQTDIVRAGEILFIDNSYACDFRQCGDEPLVFLNISMSGTSPEQYFTIMSTSAKKPVLFRSSQKFDTQLSKILYYMKYPTNRNNVLMANTLSDIFTELYLSQSGEQDIDPIYNHPQWFVDMISYIENRSLTFIRIPDIAKALNMSESHFYKLFREYTSITPYQYLLSIKIKHAQTMLVTTDNQVKYIASSVGFSSVNHFIAHFRKATGYTPMEYRKIRKV